MPSRAQQLAGSVLVALAIVVVAIVLVVARLGPGSGDDSGKRRGGDRDKIERRDDRGRD